MKHGVSCVAQPYFEELSVMQCTIMSVVLKADFFLQDTLVRLYLLMSEGWNFNLLQRHQYIKRVLSTVSTVSEACMFLYSCVAWDHRLSNIT